MITIENRRFNGRECPPFIRQTNTQEAFQLLVMCELAYGGTVCEMTGTRLVVTSRIMDCIDTTIFTGSVAEMHPLVQLARTYTDVQCDHWDSIVNSAARVMEGHPFRTATSLGEMHVGMYSLRIAALVSHGLSGQQAVTIADEMSLGDIVAGIELSQEFDIPFHEVIQ